MKKRTITTKFSLAILSFMLANQAMGQLAVTTSQTNVTCNGGSDGTATAIPSGGTGNYSYSWSPSGGTGLTATGLAPGTYTVTLTDTIIPQLGPLYSQDFEGAHGWTLNVSTGVNGADPNFWTVSDAEGGVAAGGCGVASNGNKTLHITSVFFPTGGAAYDAGGLCGLLFCPQTSSRAESPVFATTNYTNTQLEFDYIANGDALIDNASVWYNDGSGWTLLTASIKSVICGGGQGQWTHYTMTLPASCNNNANVRVGINWVNNDDGVGTDPSVAINNVVVSGQAMGAVLQTTTATVTITAPAALTSTITESACTNYTLNGQTYTNSGTYQQTVQNSNGCDSTITLNLTIIPGPVSGITQIDAITLQSTATNVTYQWIDCADDQPIVGETLATFTASQNGQFAVTVSNGTCSTTSACVTISQVGLEEGIDLMEIQVFPNPASHEVNLLFADVNETELIVFDLQGKVVMNAQSVHSGDVISLESINNGVYLMQFSSPSGVSVKRIIKE